MTNLANRLEAGPVSASLLAESPYPEKICVVFFLSEKRAMGSVSD